MDTTTFDSIARNLGGSMTRRSALRGLIASAVAAVAGGAILQADDASAKRRRRRKSRNQNQHPSHDTCGVHGDGCGAYDADTGEFTPPYCCHGYECVYNSSTGSTSWTCEAVH